jgi:hypothetical protein
MLKATTKALEQMARKDSTGAYNYFLYKHSVRWSKEPDSWKKYSEDKTGASEALRSCIRAFKIPGWK